MESLEQLKDKLIVTNEAMKDCESVATLLFHKQNKAIRHAHTTQNKQDYNKGSKYGDELEKILDIYSDILRERLGYLYQIKYYDEINEMIDK